MHEAVELELALLTPAVRRSREQLNDLLHSDFSEIGASGRLWSRAEMVASLVADDQPSGVIEAQDIRCLEAGPDLVIVTYVSYVLGRAARRTSLWRRSDQRWRLLHHQGTPLPPDSMSSSDLRWPQLNPRSGPVTLRAFRSSDASMVEELATDSYVPLIGSLPAHADTAAAAAWIGRQHARLAEDVGFSFCIADEQDRPLGFAGLWTRGLLGGRATAGFAIRSSARGRGIAAHALEALTGFGWTLPDLHRIELYIEPANLASRRTAERAGYLHEGILRQHQEIGGTRRDMCLYAVLRQKPPKQPQDH